MSSDMNPQCPDPACDNGFLYPDGHAFRGDPCPNPVHATPAAERSKYHMLEKPPGSESWECLKCGYITISEAEADEHWKNPRQPEPTAESADIGGFLKKYMDADGNGDMVKIGMMAYDMGQMLATAKAESRVKALTDVDNLNLLDDSEAWHNFYMAEIEALKGDTPDENI